MTFLKIHNESVYFIHQTSVATDQISNCDNELLVIFFPFVIYSMLVSKYSHLLVQPYSLSLGRDFPRTRNERKGETYGCEEMQSFPRLFIAALANKSQIVGRRVLISGVSFH